MPYRTILSFEELRRKQQEIRSLSDYFDRFNDIQIVITDEYANIIYVNNATEQITGYSVLEIIGKTPADLWGGYEEDEYYDNLWQTIKNTKKTYRGDITNKKKDYTPIYQQLNIIPIQDDKENIILYLAIEAVKTDPRVDSVKLPIQLEQIIKLGLCGKLTLTELIKEIEKVN